MNENPDDEVVRRQLEQDGESPSDQIATIVAELEAKETTQLRTMYDTLDGVIDNIFADPPSPDAQLRIEFTYEGYRITVEQSGAATFEKTA
ncbi:HalOD1 output domain-containing protein [Haloarchaeobius sp. HRN-SO-5]|uniref:HalOD1 output domain-containing protein n=1 Tax=Haloarchaeobius sp. HRN-SO-5 TaxID=3446118 RepID=UPI003EB97EA0